MPTRRVCAHLRMPIVRAVDSLRSSSFERCTYNLKEQNRVILCDLHVGSAHMKDSARPTEEREQGVG